MDKEKKIKITDFKTLQAEKLRLKAICEIKKDRFDNELQFLKNNYPEIAVRAVLPFDDKTNEKIFDGAKWVNASVGKLFGSRVGNFLSGTGGNLIQSVLIIVAFRFIKTIVQKKLK